MIVNVKLVKKALVTTFIVLLTGAYTWFSLSTSQTNKTAFTAPEIKQAPAQLAQLAPGNLFVIGRQRQDEETPIDTQVQDSLVNITDDEKTIALVGIFGVGEENVSVFMVGNEKKTLLVNDWITSSMQITSIVGNEVRVSVNGESTTFSLFPTNHNSQ